MIRLKKIRAKYIIRLDDASPYADLDKWNKIEEILDKYKVKPIVAVIPDNKDPTLMFNQINPNFWNMVRNWNVKGWDIAMHGHQHLFHIVPRNKSIVPYYDRSEFSGLSLKNQKNKIKKSLEIFHLNEIEPLIWVAPAHSFDYVTLQAIEQETKIEIISDGIGLLPYYKNKFKFLPQQLWYIKRKFIGIWTICLHPDTMSYKEIEDFELSLSSVSIYKNTISASDSNMHFSKESSVFNFCFASIYWGKYKLARFYRKFIK